ncbi:MAG: GIY-YIG nuclease family protein [Ignavibacteria bacterium]|nr:GIY-YIG nuclease family protein [Ignavibacteria bacterium]
MFTVYILRSTINGSYYYGQTSDIQKRFDEHNSGLSGYTKRYMPWELIYTEEYATRSEAMIREKFLKSYNGYKWLVENKIIGKKNPD